jgi:arabinogalactan endo-1,4-beta-galactosidase|tara:strand:+ start:55 stop:420 length:366 start_codon:yes stop_codon:yes gene_type:complete
MLADIWKSIGGDHEGQGQIPLSNCKNLLRAIQNFHHQDIMDLEREQTTHIDTMNIGRETVNGLLFTSEEIEFITRKYIDLYSNRQDKLAQDKKDSHLLRAYQKQNYGEQYRFQPQTLRKSN